MYLEITNIAQGINIAILVYVITTPEFGKSIELSNFSSPILAFSSLMIVILFWVRYYLDTQILQRSFTIFSATWFFLYTVIQGISISLVTRPVLWFAATSLFLFFGSGFYWLNIKEIKRKQNAGMVFSLQYVDWQTRRLIDLIILSILSLSGAYFVVIYPSIVFPASLIVVVLSLWQVSITNDYRLKSFIEAGI